MEKEDYYKILGIKKNASKNEIKRAYRRLAMKYHPDRNPGNKNTEENFKKVKEAYETLSNEQKRSNYDQFGHNANTINSEHNFNDFTDTFNDIFSDFFGKSSSRSNKKSKRSSRGSDVYHTIYVTLEEAAYGCIKKINVPMRVKCKICNTSGIKPGTKIENCKTCHGSGSIRTSQGFFSIQQTCPVCNGLGTYVPTPCIYCNGIGKTRGSKILEIKVPSGIDNGMKIRVSGKGEPGTNKGPYGDLYVEISIKTHKIFEREGNDLHCRIPLTFSLVALGGNIEIPTLSGYVSFNIPTGTQSGKIFRLRNKGIHGLRSKFTGNLYIHIQVETPVNLKHSQRKLLKKFEESLSENEEINNPITTGWFKDAKAT